MKLLSKKHLPMLSIIIGNLIPIIAYILFGWDIKETLLYFAAEYLIYEISIIPKIIVYSAYKQEVLIGKIFASFFTILLNINFFFFSFFFLLKGVFGGYDMGGDDEINLFEILLFLKTNFLAILYIFFQYSYSFFNFYIKNSIYKKRPKKDIELEFFGIYHIFIILGYFISFPIMLLLLATNIDKDTLTNGFLIVFFISAKTLGQYLIKRKNNKYLLVNKNIQIS